MTKSNDYFAYNARSNEQIIESMEPDGGGAREGGGGPIRGVSKIIQLGKHKSKTRVGQAPFCKTHSAHLRRLTWFTHRAIWSMQIDTAVVKKRLLNIEICGLLNGSNTR